MAENYKCLECFISKRTTLSPDHDRIAQLKPKFTEYENLSGRAWMCVEASAREFRTLLCDAKQAGCHPEEIFPADKACNVLISLLSSAVRNPGQLSEVLTTVYHCVRLSKKYHYQVYNARRFWCILFDHILTLPDQQFFESTMIFVFVIAQTFTERTSQLFYNGYHITVDHFMYLSASFFPDKVFPVFQKLHELEGRNFSSKSTAFTLDYREVVSPLFAPAVAEKEWYSLKQNRPVDFMVLLIHVALRRPLLEDLLIVREPGIPVLMSVMRDKKCKHMHAALMSSIDAMLSMETTDSRFELLHLLLNRLDYPLILKLAVHDEIPYLRARAQKVILLTIRFIDAVEKSGGSFGNLRKNDLIEVSLIKLKDMITQGNIDDRIFAFSIVTEHTEEKRERIIKDRFLELAARVLETHDDDSNAATGCRKEAVEQLIARALNLLMSIGPLDEVRYKHLMRHYTVRTLSKFYGSDYVDVKLLSRVCTVNICQTNFDRKLELYRTVDLRTLTDEIHKWYHSSDVKSITFTQLLPVTVKLIHYYLTINHHLKVSGVLEKFGSERMRYMKMLSQPNKYGKMYAFLNGENWSKVLNFVKTERLNKSSVCIEPSLGVKMAEIFSATVFDANMPERYNTIAVACLAHLMHDEQLDVSKYITNKLVREANDMYSDPINKFYLSDGGDFMQALAKLKVKKLSLKDTDEKKKSSLATAAGEKEAVKKKIVNNSGQRDNSPPVEDIDIGNESTDKSLKKQKTCALPTCPNHNPPMKEDSDVKVQRMKKCGKCRSVMYCGKECQVTHWSEHKRICKKLTAVQE